MTTIITIVDAIAEDVASYAPTTPYLDWRYVEPETLGTEQAPWLAVYSPNTRHELLATTDQYDHKHLVVVEWATSIASGAELGQAGQPALIAALVAALRPLEQQLETYAAGVPGFTNQIVAVLEETERSAGPGLVFRSSTTMAVEQLPT